MKQLPNLTLLFLVKRDQGKVIEICLAMKKRGFGKDKWNGVGGKLNPGETIEQAAIRETKEEINVDVKEFDKVAIIDFFFLNNPDWDQQVHAYFCESWTGEPEESEEMSPKWFSPDYLPFAQMWPDDADWLPKVIDGNLVRASFTFEQNDTITAKEVAIVKNLATS